MAHPTLTNSELKPLKARAQLLEPVVRIGKAGLTDSVHRAIDQALDAHELVKIRMDHDRDERDALVSRIGALTGGALVMQVGKVAVFYRRKPSSGETKSARAHDI
jgi:RNA-binding protein